MKKGSATVWYLSLLGLSFLTGCATIFAGGPQSVTLKSDPTGATYQYGPYSGRTPDTIQASRQELAHTATFKLAGYEDKTVPVQTGIQGVTWLDILFWPGFLVDFLNGSANRLETPVVAATLSPLTNAVGTSGTAGAIPPRSGDPGGQTPR